MNKLLIFISVATILCESCLTFTLSNGKKYRQFLPAKDKISASTLDTSKFIRQPFNLSDYKNKIAYKDGKKIIEPIEGADIQTLLNTKERYYIYFWNPVCAGTLPDIHKFDSLSLQGEHVLIISLRKNYDAIDNRLRKTNFSHYPYYTIEAKRFTNILLRRQIRFIKEACVTCYDRYKDDLAVADYLLIDNETIRPVLYNDSTNIFRH